MLRIACGSKSPHGSFVPSGSSAFGMSRSKASDDDGLGGATRDEVERGARVKEGEAMTNLQYLGLCSRCTAVCRVRPVARS